MIVLETIVDNIIKVTVPETLKADDFSQLSQPIDALIAQLGEIRLLVDATAFNGWENVDAFEKHMQFVKTHHHNVKRGAIIVSHSWQHWVAGIVRIFVHPEIHVFDKGQTLEALDWLKS